MEAIWQKGLKTENRKQLVGTHQTKVAVIGAGMAGLLTAYLLKEAGMKVMVVEAETIASGQTGGTTAKITSQHGMIYQYLTENFGTKGAEQYARANQEAIREYERIIQKENIDCDFCSCSSYLYAVEGEGAEDRVKRLKQETEAAIALGIEAEFVTETELPFSVAGAEKFPGQAQFHPVKFLKHIAKGLEVYENTRVFEVKDNCLFTKKGLIEADYIVFAMHYPWMVTPGYYFLRMHQARSYVLALEQEKPLQGIYRDMEQSGLSFRSQGKYLLLGGGGHRTGKNSDNSGYAWLRQQAEVLYPGKKEVACWSAQDCMTLDRVPYIGYLSAAIPNWYVATGFGKWGMTSSMASAMIIRDMIQGTANWNEDIFSPQRMNWKASIPELVGNIGSAVKNLSKRLWFFPLETAEELACGEGKIVRYQGKKAGVYKDMEGNVYAVDVGCRHMGCQLTWNPQELTWDCPCHGSRYDFKGNLICDPAQESLERK